MSIPGEFFKNHDGSKITVSSRKHVRKIHKNIILKPQKTYSGFKGKFKGKRDTT